MIIDAFGSWDVEWPWPQIRHGHGNIVAFAVADWGLCQGGVADGDPSLVLFELYYSEGNLHALPAAQIHVKASQVVSVDFASFGDFYVVSAVIVTDDPSTPTIKTFVRDVYENLGLTSVSPISGAPAGLALCNFNQQAIIGGLQSMDSKWSTLGLGGIAWGGIGNFEFDPTLDPTAGSTQIRTVRRGEGIVYKLLRLNKGVVTYTNAGCQTLGPFATEYVSGFGESLMSFPGVASANHVAGDELRHAAIATDGNVWLLTEEKGLVKVGYKEFIFPMLRQGKVILSYLPQRRTFYLSNATKSYMLNEFGLCEIHQSVTSVMEINGFLTGFTKDLGDYEVRLKMGDIDFDLGGFKTVETMEISAKYDTTALLQAGVDFSVGQNTAWRSGALKRVGPQGFTSPIVTAQVFRPKIQAADYRNFSELKLSNLKLRFKISDKRGIRGKYVG